MTKSKARGWKTYVGAIGLMLTALGAIAKGVSADAIDISSIKEGLMIFWLGLTGLGLGHKAQKLLEK